MEVLENAHEPRLKDEFDYPPYMEKKCEANMILDSPLRPCGLMGKVKLINVK